MLREMWPQFLARLQPYGAPSKLAQSVYTHQTREPVGGFSWNVSVKLTKNYRATYQFLKSDIFNDDFTLDKRDAMSTHF